MKSSTPLCVICSDLHLSLVTPACRKEDDWLAVQARYLRQLREESNIVICAGDIFDKWNTSPELLNFALQHLPDGMICVPGQHDLPNHSYEERHRSGYEVLKRAGKIFDLSEGHIYFDRHYRFAVQGFGWEQEIKFAPTEPEVDVQIAAIHKYVYDTPSNAFPGASESGHLRHLYEQVRDFNAVAIGDNHRPWFRTPDDVGDTWIMNCGTFIRRKSDEIGYRPTFGVVMSDGSIVRKEFYGIEDDRFHEHPKEREEQEFDTKEFIQELENLGEHGLNFRDAVEQHLKKENLSSAVKSAVLRALEGDNKA